MVLGIPFRRAPVATCDLIQAVLGSAVPEDTAVAEQAQRLKMAFALATSKPSGKEFTLKCKELLKADSIGIYAVAHNTSQLRNCLPLALLATSEPEDAIDSGVSQLRTEAMIHCVGAKDGASTIVACAGKSYSMHVVADAEGVVIDPSSLVQWRESRESLSYPTLNSYYNMHQFDAEVGPSGLPRGPHRRGRRPAPRCPGSPGS